MNRKEILKKMVSFNSPESFINIVKFGDLHDLLLIIRHIKTQPESVQALFLSEVDGDGRHALCLAAALDKYEMVLRLYPLGFNLEAQDVFEHRVFYYLALNKRLSLFPALAKSTDNIQKEEASLLSQNKHMLLGRTKQLKKEWGNAISFSRNNIKQAGRLPKTHPIEERRPYRSFANEREQQLLRQAATQLYFALNIQLNDQGIKNLVEIQIMHLEFNGKHNLFIAANEHAVSQYFPRLIQDKKIFIEMLTNVHSPSDKEGKIRSRRYASKLTCRVFQAENFEEIKESNDKSRSQQVMSLLKNGVLYNLPLGFSSDCELLPAAKQLLRHIFLNTKNHIYLMDIKNDRHLHRHAEEFLSDVADYASIVGAEQGVIPYDCVGGKKRPCIGCMGRMTRSISQFGQNPGRFWLHTLEHQPADIAVNTINTLLTKPAHVTVCKDGKTLATDYGSGSDSEEDKPRRIRLVRL